MTKFGSDLRSTRSVFIWLLFAAAGAFIYFYDLTLPLVGPDEARYSQVAREMFMRGDWITPTLGGFNWFEKPALLYWLQIVSYNLFGVSEFSARFGSAVFGILTVVSLWILGRHVQSTNVEHGAASGFSNWLALIAGSTVGIIAFSHGASFDIILTFPITAALVAYYLFDHGQKRTGALVAFYFFVGLAALAKGLVGLLFPFAIVGFYHLLMARLPDRRFFLSLTWGTFLTITVAATWYLPMYLRHGYEFIDQFFIQHHFQRYTSNKYLHPQPFYFFLWVLPLMTVPWLPFFFAAIVGLAGRIVRRLQGVDLNGSADRYSLQIFALAWIAVPVIFFSFSGSKLPGYVLPSVPAAMILTADLVFHWMRKGAIRRYFVQVFAAGTFIVLVAVMTFVVPMFASDDTVKGLFTVAEQRGFGDTPVLMLHGVSHNAEFYAPGRIIRDSDGKQKKVYGPPEVLRIIRQQNGEPLLVMVPMSFLYQLTESEFLATEVLGDNGVHALAIVREKQD